VTELVCVIVATYNREDALDAVLRGLAAQSDPGFDVIVADDGSGPATKQLVESWSSRLRLRHVWHEDRGFRAGEIRNRAILATSAEICILLDGDCIPRRDFVAAHRRLAEPGWFVAGNRVLLSRELTERVLDQRLEPERWPLTAWMAARRRHEINRVLPLLPLRLGPLRRLGSRAWEGVRSANLAVRRADLIAVDGFDARFSGWGREDSDLVVRLIRSGIRRKDGRFATGVLHLWHAESDRSRLPENDRMLDEVVRGDGVKALVGLSAVAAGAPSG
jgi:glycosyltransferase involved in cell wall biosynthesis